MTDVQASETVIGNTAPLRETCEGWALPSPFLLPIAVSVEALDGYGHVNNAEYVRWLERISWAHSEALGLGLEHYRAQDRGMAVHRHEIDYLASARLGDSLMLATWLVACDGRLSLTRRFQLRRCSDGLTLLEARTRFVCIELSSGRARRMPEAYRECYSAALVSEDAVSQR
ncbi:thioesterase family protein [Cobetia sp. 14N.309.X.WAT.E.A4]|uniref:acyl-CoA thioesterase n=1 Tax=Cobetia sp. 14N.309.X.WAT.E.A4 TaxID=2998323 RepID=UPI0025B196B0|nr:thioesterase family protein [Cobetia sp. 14N.309.X.WAT.E.A4]MDN2657161.1 thioesterase family protein [Cobetia sp. 14N.309.X.WAT.E.A4]